MPVTPETNTLNTPDLSRAMANETCWIEPEFDPTAEANADRVAAEINAEIAAEELAEKIGLATPSADTSYWPSQPRRAEAVDRSLKTEEDRRYWSSRTPEKKADQAADSRKIDGLARTTARLTTNEQKHHQLLSKGQAALSGDHEVLHAMLTKYIALRELDRKEDRKEMDQFMGSVMESFEQLLQKVDRLEQKLDNL